MGCLPSTGYQLAERDDRAVEKHHAGFCPPSTGYQPAERDYKLSWIAP